jgi:two-component system, NarL family, nitrate/nitrite response regulator NarL
VLFADAITPALEREGMTVVGVASTAAEAFEAVERERPDLTLMDIGLPDQSGLVAGQQILERFPDTKVVALSARDDHWAVDQALDAGFLGFITKDTGVSDFVEAVRAVVDGQVVLTRRTDSRRGRPDDGGAALMAEQLTPREREVLALLVRGASGDAIASPLGISPNTVRTHVQSILTKLQVHSRLEAAAFAVRYHLVDDSGRSTQRSRMTGTDR